MYMKQLGIQSGDVVKVTSSRSAPAICLPLDHGYKKPYDPEMEYLDETSKSVPHARVSSSVCSNIRNFMSNLVEIEKTDAEIASTVTLGTANNAYPFDKKDLLFDKVNGFVIGLGDGLNIPTTNSDQISIPFLVLDANPKGTFWKIDKTTKFEFQNIKQDEIFPYNPPKLKKIIKVISLARQFQVHDFDLILPSLEIYDDGMRLPVYMNYEKYDNAVPFQSPQASISVVDDLDNKYFVIGMESQGSGSDAEGLRISGSIVFGPAPASNAKELRLTILEMSWSRPLDFAPMNTQNPEETAFRYMRESPSMKFTVMSGPWEFKIPLK